MNNTLPQQNGACCSDVSSCKPVRSVAPHADVRELDGRFEIKLDIPAAIKDSLDVKVEGRKLQVRARCENGVPEGFRVLHSENAVEGYERIFTLGETVDTESIEAELHDGVLTISVNKRPESTPKKIAVKVH